MNQDIIPLQADDAKVRQLITKIKKSLKGLSISNNKNIVLPPREELFNSKYHVNYLELRKEGLAIEKLIKEAEEQDISVDSSNTIPKFINPHYLDVRFSIFTCHSPPIANIDNLQFELSLKFGQIVAVHSDSNEIFLGMIANKLDEDVYRVFDLSDVFMFTICTSNQICPFPSVLPKTLSASTAFSTGDKVIAFSTVTTQDRKQFQIQSGEVVCLVSNNNSKEQSYNIKLKDETVITIEPQFLTKYESPFKCENEQAEELKQECIENGIDPTIMLDPKEARKFKQANAKKLRSKKKAEASSEVQQQDDKQIEADGNQAAEGQNSTLGKKKERKRSPTSMTTRSRSNPVKKASPKSKASSNTNETNETITLPSPQNDVNGIQMKLPIAADMNFIDQNSVSGNSSAIAAPPRVMQLQNFQMSQVQQQQQQYIYQQQYLQQQKQQQNFSHLQFSPISQVSQIQQQQPLPQQQAQKHPVHEGQSSQLDEQSILNTHNQQNSSENETQQTDMEGQEENQNIEDPISNNQETKSITIENPDQKELTEENDKIISSQPEIKEMPEEKSLEDPSNK